MIFHRALHLIVALFTLLAANLAAAVELPASVTELYENVRPSVVVITVAGRSGDSKGVGTGFVVSDGGLIVTNKHVIGEGRDISIQLANGKTIPVQAVHATSTKHDLAILQVEAKGLRPIPLGNSAKLQTGEPVIAVGNPHGLAHSVVSGVVSAKREIDGMPMIQLALPIEPGNSGGPLIDHEGRVVGIVTMKSVVTANLGFAVESDALKPLLEHPNPIPMARWRTIGTIDPAKWEVHLGSDWKQRAGRIVATEPGRGFGGRTLCLSKGEVPKTPYEVAVTVRLGEDSGAAGLIFAADGGDRHYGFYPSGGQVRLTRFDGPDIFSWTILAQVTTSHYVSGDWNRLKVRVEDDTIRCFVNDQLVIESKDVAFREGRVGLAKFRDTTASFRDFAVGEHLERTSLSDEITGRLDDAIKRLTDAPTASRDQTLVETFLETPAESTSRLRHRARELELEAQRMRILANKVHEQSIIGELDKVFKAADADVDLLRAALLLSRLDNDEVDVEAYAADVDRMADEIREMIPKDASDDVKLAAIDKYLFEEHGYHGSRGDYYSRSNSYMNEVIDDREGLPITLSVLYMELARRIGPKVVGVGLPGHFVVRYEPAEGSGQFIDVHNRGVRLTEEEARRRIAETFEEEVNPSSFVLDKRHVISRMLSNLMGIARGERDVEGMLRYLNAAVAVDPESAVDRWQRGVLRLETGDHAGAAEDARWLLEHDSSDVDRHAVERLLELAQNKDG